MKFPILILLFVASCFNLMGQCPIRRTFEPNEIVDSIKYDCNIAMQVIQSGGHSDTIFKKICTERNAVIFIEGRNYTYKSAILDSNSNIISCSNVKLIGTNNRFNSVGNKQVFVEMVFDRFIGDSASLHPISQNSGCCPWVNSEKEGIIENVERFWIHPIRSNQFLLTETACFPEVIFPLTVGREWTGSLQIHEYGSWAGRSLKNSYSVLGKKTFTLQGETLDCWEIVGISTFDGKENKLTYLFNEQFGFVLMQYAFYNGIRINFEMIEATKK